MVAIAKVGKNMCMIDAQFYSIPKVDCVYFINEENTALIGLPMRTAGYVTTTENGIKFN